MKYVVQFVINFRRPYVLWTCLFYNFFNWKVSRPLAEVKCNWILYISNISNLIPTKCAFAYWSRPLVCQRKGERCIINIALRLGVSHVVIVLNDLVSPKLPEKIWDLKWIKVKEPFGTYLHSCAKYRNYLWKILHFDAKPYSPFPGFLGALLYKVMSRNQWHMGGTKHHLLLKGLMELNYNILVFTHFYSMVIFQFA